MRILILFVHPKRDSFSGRVADATRRSLEAQGHEVELAHLYAEGFNPALIPEDFAQFADEPMPPDVLSEQARVDRNEALIVVTPIWWWQYPAMLKGWIDRVFVGGWAFSNSSEPNAAPILSLRKVLMLASAGAGPARFAKYGYVEGIQTLWNTGVWGYCGLGVQTSILWSVDPYGMAEAELQRRLDEATGIAREFVDGCARDAPALTSPRGNVACVS